MKYLHITILNDSPPLDLAEVKGDSPIGQGLLVEVLGVPPDERRHVISCHIITSIDCVAIYMVCLSKSGVVML